MRTDTEEPCEPIETDLIGNLALLTIIGGGADGRRHHRLRTDSLVRYRHDRFGRTGGVCQCHSYSGGRYDACAGCGAGRYDRPLCAQETASGTLSGDDLAGGVSDLARGGAAADGFRGGRDGCGV